MNKEPLIVEEMSNTYQLAANNDGLRKGYKKTEMGVIPEDWEIVPLGCIATIEGGYAFSSKKFLDCGKYQIVKMSNLYGGILNLKRSATFLNELNEQEKCYLLCENDILITLTGTTGKRDYGFSHRISQEMNLLVNQRVAKITIGKNVDASYIAFQIKAPDFLDQFFEVSKGGTGNQTNVGTADVSAICISCPSFPEQRAIAVALSDVDALIAKLDQFIAKKRDLKQAAMQQLLTGQTRLPGFSGDWKVKTFGEVFDYLPTATNSRSDLSDSGDTFYVHYGDIHMKFHSHLDFLHTSPPMILRHLCKNAVFFKNGDWVMADASEDFDGVGKTIEITGIKEGMQAVAGLHTFLLREKTSTFASGYKGHLGNLYSLHQQFLRVATGLKVFGVSKAALKHLVLNIPSPEEQTAIATILSDMDSEIKALEARRDKARDLKQGMMQELLTGKIRLL